MDFVRINNRCVLALHFIMFLTLEVLKFAVGTNLYDNGTTLYTHFKPDHTAETTMRNIESLNTQTLQADIPVHRKNYSLDNIFYYHHPRSVLRETPHGLRKPVIADSSHNQRQPVEIDSSQFLQKPVKVDASHSLRKPVKIEISHNRRRPVASYLLNYHQLTVGILSPTTNFGFNQSIAAAQEGSTENNGSNDAYSIPNQNNSISLMISFLSSNVITNDNPGVEHNDISNDGGLMVAPPKMNENREHSVEKENDVKSTSSQDMVLMTCGISRVIMARIVGGRIANYLRWPWMISLRYQEDRTFKHKCGAVLLNRLWAATVAHCVYKKRPSDIILRLGDYNLHHIDEQHPHVEMNVLLLILHPDFNSLTYENDIALLRFYQTSPDQINIVPVCLPSASDSFHGQTAVVTGWGRLSEDGELPAYLHEVHLSIINNEDCQKMYHDAGFAEFIPEVFICGGSPSGGLDACEGDSGGPMVVMNDQGAWVLAGLISWGIGCAAPKQPGVYVRISKFVGWINDIISI